MKTDIKTCFIICTITIALAVLLAGSKAGGITSSTDSTQNINISEINSSTLQTPNTGLKETDSSYTVPRLADLSGMQYAITVKGGATGTQLSQDFDPNTADYDLNALAAGQTITLFVKAPSDARVTVNGNGISPNQDYSIKINEISKSNNIVVAIHLNGENERDYTIHTYHRSLPSLNYTAMSGASFQDGIYTFALSPYLIRMNTAGQIVYYRSFQFLTKDGEPFNFNFKPVQYSDGTKRFIYNIGVNNEKRVGTGYSNGMCVVMDENYKEIEFIHLQAYGWHSEGYLDDHDFILLSDNHWICESYTLRNVDNIPGGVSSNFGTGKVIAGIIQEVENGKVVMEFDTTDHPFFYQTSKEKNDFTSNDYQDYVHINSLFLDPKDGNLIVSMRNQYAVYKIDRSTGKILWVLGGDGDQFNLSDNQKFVGQHAASIAKDGSLLLFNNNTGSGLSEIMNFYLDETNKTVKLMKSYTVSDYYGDYCGNAYETTGGNQIVGWGLCQKYTSPIFTEVNPTTGEILSSLFSEKAHSYRTYKSAF